MLKTPAAMEDCPSRPDTPSEDSMILASYFEEKNDPTPEGSPYWKQSSTPDKASDQPESVEHRDGAQVALRDTDVICSRGFFRRQPGNIRYRALLTAYFQKDEEQYARHSRIIVCSIMAKKARYVKQDKKRAGGWVDIGYTEACRTTLKALKDRKQKLVHDEEEKERKIESTFQKAEAATRAKGANNKVVSKSPTQEDLVECDVLINATPSLQIENRPGNIFFQQILTVYRDAYRKDPRPGVGEQLVVEILIAFKASGRRFMVSIPSTSGAKKSCIEMQESELKQMMADAIAAPPVGTSSASSQGMDQQRCMPGLYSAGLGNTFLPGRLTQCATRGLDAFMENDSPAAGLLLPPSSVALGDQVSPTNILGNQQDMRSRKPSISMFPLPKKCQQGLPTNELLNQKVPAAFNLEQYVLKNWREKLRDSYQDIPETSLPREEMFPYSKRDEDLMAARKKKDKNENKKRRGRWSKTSSENERDCSSSDEEESTEKPSTGAVISFDDGRKWRVERVGNVNILSPYI